MASHVRGTGLPKSRDVFVWLKFQVAAGRFGGGARLPAIDLLSVRLGVEPFIVEDAYRMLKEQSGTTLSNDPAGRSTGLNHMAHVIDMIASVNRS